MPLTRCWMAMPEGSVCGAAGAAAGAGPEAAGPAAMAAAAAQARVREPAKSARVFMGKAIVLS
ncbi:hypothetical protein D9M72_595650 [compost metagenome]